MTESDNSRRKIVAGAIIVQLVLLLVMVFGDFGFDRPGRFGLDFEDLVLVWAVYFLAAMVGLVTSWKGSRAWLFLLQLAFPCFVYCGVALATLKPHFEASEYQHLVGKTHSEVEQELGKQSHLTSGFQGNEGVQRGFKSYRGMMLYFSVEGHQLGVVTKVEPEIP